MKRPGIRLTYEMMALSLLLSAIIVLDTLGLIQFQREGYESAKSFALDMLENNLTLAEELRIPENDDRVNFNRLKLENAIHSALTTEEINHIILTEMSAFEQLIRDQAEINLTNWLEWVINQDPNLDNLEESTDIIISFLAEQQVAIEGGDFLDEETLSRFTNYSLPSALRLQTVTIAVEVGEDSVTTRVKAPMIEQDPILHLQNQYMFWEQEYEQMLTLAGYSELTGPGLVISLIDAEDKIEENIIHDVDVQEVVHSLYASGAQGISVGGRRLVADTSIRCVGPTILVNYDAIPVDPVVIKAVGDAESMLTYIQPILDYYTEVRDLRIEVSTEEQLRLPAQPVR